MGTLFFSDSACSRRISRTRARIPKIQQPILYQIRLMEVRIQCQPFTFSHFVDWMYRCHSGPENSGCLSVCVCLSTLVWLIEVLSGRSSCVRFNFGPLARPVFIRFSWNLYLGSVSKNWVWDCFSAFYIINIVKMTFRKTVKKGKKKTKKTTKKTKTKKER